MQRLSRLQRQVWAVNFRYHNGCVMNFDRHRLFTYHSCFSSPVYQRSFESKQSTMDLVISVVTAWETCVQVFEIIDSGKKYGVDYEVLRVKLEVERIRFLVWGGQ